MTPDCHVTTITRLATPFVFVAPHGVDDLRTSDVVFAAAKKAGCSAHVNLGFHRGEAVDEACDQADCNRISHTGHPVVHAEYRRPLLRLVSMIKRYHGECILINVHGMKDSSARLISDSLGSTIDCVLGCGRKPRITCGESVRDSIIYGLVEQNLEVVLGVGNNYVGSHQDNMNTYFRHVRRDSDVDSLQLELPRALRSSLGMAHHTGELLGLAVLKAQEAWDSEDLKIEAMTVASFVPTY